MDEKTRVVFFHIGRDVFGGGSKMLLRLLRSLDPSEFEPVLISQFDDELCKRARENGIHVEIVPFRGALDTYNRQLLTKSPTTLFATGLRIAQFNIDAFSHFRRADVIWCKNLRAVLTLFPYIIGTRIPVIWNIGLGLESSGSIRYLNTLALQSIDHVFIESEDQAQQVFTEDQYQRYQHKFTTFHKGIDLDTFDPEAVDSTIEVDTELCVGTAASLTPRKGLEYFIEAIPQVLEEHDDVTFLIAGEAPDGHEDHEQYLKRRVNELNIEDRVRFLGWVEDMPQYLNSLDVFVLPSLNEGIPGAVREALAMEVPVVATDVGGVSDAVNQGETGLLVPPTDSGALADALKILCTNKDKRQQYANAGRSHTVENFSVQSYVDNYEQFLTRAVTT